MSVKLGNINIAGTQVLYSSKGNNTDGAMTQASTTAELNNCVTKTGTDTISGDKAFTGALTIPAGTLISKQSSVGGDEGGELHFEVGTNSPLLSTVKVDVYQGRFRVFGTASDGVTREIINADIENNNLRAPASNAIGSVITTLALILQDIGIGGSYLKLGNGVIIQWGYVGGSITNHAITFPTPFSSSTCYVCVPVVRGFSATVYTTNYTATGASVVTSANGAIAWIAIGY